MLDQIYQFVIDNQVGIIGALIGLNGFLLYRINQLRRQVNILFLNMFLNSMHNKSNPDKQPVEQDKK